MTLSAIKPMLNNITDDILVEKDWEPLLIKEVEKKKVKTFKTSTQEKGKKCHAHSLLVLKNFFSNELEATNISQLCLRGLDDSTCTSQGRAKNPNSNSHSKATSKEKKKMPG